jgi:hypothetical protein
MSIESQKAPKLARLQQICRTANREAFLLEATRKTCVLTSAALCHVLPQLGFTARPLRIRAAVHHPSDYTKCGVILGGNGDGTRPLKASPHCWHGHLGVIANEQYLLDATIDQAGDSQSWIRITEPFVSWVSPRFLSGAERVMQVSHGNAVINYSVAPKQVGFRSAPDFKYRSHWRPLAQRILLSS